MKHYVKSSNTEPGNMGIKILATLLLNWIALDHFTRILANWSKNITLPLANCLVTLKLEAA